PGRRVVAAPHTGAGVSRLHSSGTPLTHPSPRGAGRGLGRGAAVLVLALAFPSLAHAEDAASVVVVVGAAGTPEYGARFSQWAERWKQAGGRAGARVTVVGADGAGPDRPRVAEALAREARAGAGPLWLV